MDADGSCAVVDSCAALSGVISRFVLLFGMMIEVSSQVMLATGQET